jgi:hypothetical protein
VSAYGAVAAADAVPAVKVTVPRHPRGLVLVLADGASAAEVMVSAALLGAGFAVLSSAEPRLRADASGTATDIPVAEIARLVGPLVTLTQRARRSSRTAGLPTGYFAVSTAAAVALQAAVELDGEVSAVVSSQGRLDLVRSCVPSVTAATLLIVGGADPVAVDHNGGVEPLFRCPRALEIVSGASPRFGEPGALERVTDLAVDWFSRYLNRDRL